MELGDMLKLRDESIKGALYRELMDNPPGGASEERLRRLEASVDKAFDAGATYWAEEQLAKIVGSRFARQVLRRTIGPG